jgi:hypothetical protein
MMKRIHALILALAFAVAGAPGVFAQDQPAGQDLPAGQNGAAAGDVFDTSAFDQNVQQSTQAGQAAKVEYLFGGSFLTDNILSGTADFNTWYTLAGSFSGKAFAKITVPDYGALYIGYLVSHDLYKGWDGTLPTALQYEFTLAPADDLFVPGFTLAELYYSFDVAHAVFFRLGNQLIAWGPSSIWTPVDFINLQKVDPQSAFDRRVGKPGLRVHVPLGNANIFLFGDFSGTVQNILVKGEKTGSVQQNPLSATNLGARVDLTVLGSELAVTGYWGSTIQNRYGFDFSGKVLGFDVYGELAAAFPYGSYDFTWAGSGGFQRTLGDLGYWSIAGEFFYNAAGTADTATYQNLIDTKTFTPLYIGQYYGYASITRSHLLVDGVSAALSWFMNFSDNSWQGSLSTSVNVPSLVPFTVSIRCNGGGSGKEFTFLTGDGAVSADLQVRFEF